MPEKKRSSHNKPEVGFRRDRKVGPNGRKNTSLDPSRHVKDGSNGRPKISLTEADAKRLEGYGYIQATDGEIEAVMGVSVDTLKRRGFWKYVELGRAQGNVNVRKKWYTKAAVEGEAWAIIWWSKQFMGAAEKSMQLGKDGEAIAPGATIVEYRVPNDGRDT